MKLNEKITYYRRRARYSQQTLADLMGVSRQSVSKWETGESLPEISKLPQLARLFGVTTDHLLSEEEPLSSIPYDEVPDEDDRTSYTSHTSTQSTSYYDTASTSGAPQQESTVDKVIAHLPHFLGKLIRLYGWLAGIRIAIAGVMLLVFCLIGSVMTGSFNTAVTRMDTQMGSMMPGFGTDSITFYDADGNLIQDVPDEWRQGVSDALGISTNGMSFSAASTFDGLFTPFFVVIAIVGVLLIVAGVALAIYLKPRLS